MADDNIITKYLLNYLFKKIDDLIEENLQLKLKLAEKETTDKVLDDLTTEAVKMAKSMGLLDDNEEADDNNPLTAILKKKSEA